ncbi:MAG: PaaI family thioesterase, partial [Candidatus Wallbacteria bacterium]|nr:PaaI family thioesterase [Candidatus Wallbacteria bacterium]
PVRQSRLRAAARVVNRGKSVGLVECDVTDTEGRLVARASSTVYVLAATKTEE